MSEVPAGMDLSGVSRRPPRPTVTMTVTRDGPEGLEVLLGLRAPTMRAFPQTWAFPGGGVARGEAEAFASTDLPSVGDEHDLARFAGAREMAEELGWWWDGQRLQVIDAEFRAALLSDRTAWARAMADGIPAVDLRGMRVISQRTTPPFGPMQFDNTFLHVHLGSVDDTPELDLEPQTEFTEMRWATPAAFLQDWRRHTMRIAPPVVSLLQFLQRRLSSNGGDAAEAMAFVAKQQPGRASILFAHGVQVVPVPTATLPPADHTNCYLIGPPGGPIVIVDPAITHRESMEHLADVVDRHGGEVQAYLYTHGHGDHVGDEDLLREAFDVPIWGHEHGGMRVDRTLNDGDVIQLGEHRWNVLHTPGHHPGHLCLLSEAGLVAGDMVAGIGTILIPPGQGNMNVYLEQLERLASLEPHMIFPSHGPVVTKPTALLNHYVSHRRARHARVLDAVQAGQSAVADIAREAYADSPDAHPGLAQDQTLAHLMAHAEEGSVVQGPDGWHHAA